MNGKQFYPISIRGRIAYVILCFENYVKVKYPDIDMQPVLRLMWSVVDSSDYIDNHYPQLKGKSKKHKKEIKSRTKYHLTK